MVDSSPLDLNLMNGVVRLPYFPAAAVGGGAFSFPRQFRFFPTTATNAFALSRQKAFFSGVGAHSDSDSSSVVIDLNQTSSDLSKPGGKGGLNIDLNLPSSHIA